MSGWMWTPQERALFLEGVKLYGQNLELIQEHLGGKKVKTLHQIKLYSEAYENRLKKYKDYFDFVRSKMEPKAPKSILEKFPNT